MGKVAVIGAGIIGLSTAVEILEKWHKNIQVTIFSDDVSPNTTGDVSAGIWGPYLLGDTPMSDIIKWSTCTQDYLLSLWKGGLANECGISFLPVIQLTTQQDQGTPSWLNITYGGGTLDDEQLDRFRKAHDANYRNGFTYLAFALEPAKYLPYLMKKIEEKGGKLVMKKIKNFAQLSNYDVIVNCTGLYSEILTRDGQMLPIRGQVCRVKSPWQYNAIFVEGIYIIPNSECTILGGTHQKGNRDLNINEDDKQFILGGCSHLVPALKNAEIINHKVGLRPGRNKVRLELEKLKIKGKQTFIIHNYGHGGSGVTLFKGCAMDAMLLVEKALIIQSSKL